MPSVSVVIPTYNYGQFVSDAIDSVLKQTRLPDEIIVVDDGSTDGTPEVLRRYGKSIRVVRKENAGLPAARNSGIEVATGDLVAFLDADDRWLPQKLACQLERFQSEPDLGLIHCGVEEIDAAGTCLRQRLEGQEGWVADEFILFQRPVVLGGGSASIIPRRILRECGGFDNSMRHSEDWDLYYRVACRWKLGFIPKVLIQYRLHSFNMHRNIDKMAQGMTYAYAKAFAGADSRLRNLRRRCFGNLHAVLAGSFFSTGQYAKSARHAVTSLVLNPRNISRFLGYPLRCFSRSMSGRSKDARQSVPTFSACTNGETYLERRESVE